jgi:tRNA pseudouridine32 synthase / 23S rRNA pseudouridine746 synthase
MQMRDYALETLLLYQDKDVLVLNKPAGLACHQGPRTEQNLEALLPDLAGALGQKRPLFLAHRLDRDTSGCLLIACGERAHKRIQQAFAARSVDKHYWAWVTGVPNKAKGMVDAPLAKVSSAAKGWRMLVNHKAGQAAKTMWEVLETGSNESLLALSPLTGRTHQVRVHCAYLGHPIVGDRVYAQLANTNALANKASNNQATQQRPTQQRPLQLHAKELCFMHPVTQQKIQVSAPLPQHFMVPNLPH